MREEQEELYLIPYRQAAEVLPEHLRRAALARCADEQAVAEEFRLRSGQKMSLLGPEGETSISEEPVTGQDLQAVLDRATEFSAYRCAGSIRQGYVTVRGGCRVGICGTAVLRGGEIATVGELSSLSIRIARAALGVAKDVYPKLWSEGSFESTLILSPPGGGKTTLLRDLIRCLSKGSQTHPALRVAVVDERGEIAAARGGCAQFDVGPHTDILTGTEKAEGISMLLRAMNPQVIAVDEITAPEDIRAMTVAANCGVAFLATVHGRDLDELRRRKLCRELLDTELFHQFIVLEGRGSARTSRVERC
ncbi:stage III sporulation protein AB [bacterium 210917-DFI.7.65]|nr:stage III sporulation protein AB [Clostridiales bacterium]MCB6900063.1 stage III sporulation protein AB [bacterium 210917-DFI.7.65]